MSQDLVPLLTKLKCYTDGWTDGRAEIRYRAGSFRHSFLITMSAEILERVTSGH